MIFRNWVLQNFPFLEDDFDALTDYELFCKMLAYVKKFGKDNEDFSKRLSDLENYINNLNLQDEVNNKLDEMAESGELTDIIAQYLQLAGVLVYNTKADLVSASNLVNGSTARTLGVLDYKNGDGSYYKIRTLTSSDVIDNELIVALTNYPTLVAEKIPNGDIENIINRRYFKELYKYDGLQYIAHRGAIEDVIENTIPSFMYAYGLGYKIFETDIQPTLDGEFVIMHNESVDALTNGTGNIRELNYSYIENLVYDAGANVSDFPNTHIATIDDLLTFIKRTNMICQLELKNYNNFFTNEKVLSLYNKIKKSGLISNFIFSSFDENLILYIRSFDKDCMIMAIEDIDETNINMCKNNNFILAIYKNSANTTRANVNLCHENGIKLCLWPIQDESDYQLAMNLGVDYVTTNTSTAFKYKKYPITYYECLYPALSYFEEIEYRQGKLLKARNTKPNFDGGYPACYDYLDLINNRAVYFKKLYVKNGSTLYYSNFDFSNFKFVLHGFSSSNTKTTDSGWITSGSSYTNNNSTNLYWIIYIAKNDNTPITEYEMEKIEKTINNNFYIIY